MATDKLKKDELNLEIKVMLARISKYKDAYNNMQIELKDYEKDKKVIIEALDKIKKAVEGIAKKYKEIKTVCISLQVDINALKKEEKKIRASNAKEEKAIQKKRDDYKVLKSNIDKQFAEYAEKIAQYGKDNQISIDRMILADSIIIEYRKEVEQLDESKKKGISEKGRLAIIREDTLKGQRALTKDKQTHEKNVRQYKVSLMKLRGEQHKNTLIKKAIKDLIKK